MHHILYRVFWQNIKSPRWLSPSMAQIWCLWLLAFPKTKVTFETEKISDYQWDSGNTMGQLMATERTVWGPKVPTLKGIEVSLFLHSMFPVSSSINASIFHITWLDNYWTDLVYQDDNIQILLTFSIIVYVNIQTKSCIYWKFFHSTVICKHPNTLHLLHINALMSTHFSKKATCMSM